MSFQESANNFKNPLIKGSGTRFASEYLSQTKQDEYSQEKQVPACLYLASFSIARTLARYEWYSIKRMGTVLSDFLLENFDSLMHMLKYSYYFLSYSKTLQNSIFEV